MAQPRHDGGPRDFVLNGTAKGVAAAAAPAAAAPAASTGRRRRRHGGGGGTRLLNRVPVQFRLYFFSPVCQTAEKSSVFLVLAHFVFFALVIHGRLGRSIGDEWQWLISYTGVDTNCIIPFCRSLPFLLKMIHKFDISQKEDTCLFFVQCW